MIKPLQQTYSLSKKRIYIAGHTGMVGSALMRALHAVDCDILTVGRSDIDLRNQADVLAWMKKEKPQAVFVPAAKVGGILANSTYPADFIYDNTMIACNIIHAAYETGVEKMLFLGSSCIYPKFVNQPIDEAELLTGSLEPTNEWYAIAKITGLKLCLAYRRQYGCNFISAMPTNLYGPGDNYDLESSHVIPALVRKAHMAKLSNAESFDIWGTGSPRREFLHVDDCASALIHLMQNYSDDLHINVGTGKDISILEIAELIADVVGFEGKLMTDETKPDGTPRKLLNTDRLNALGWQPKIRLRDGLQNAYDWFLRKYT